jgi:hypothetical protein
MKRVVLGSLIWLWTSLAAFAGVTCSVPFNLQNGTTADATQVMANYNALITCLGNAAGAGANSDITSLLALSTPIGPSVGGSTQYIGGTSTGTLNAQVVATTAPTGFTLTPGYTVIFKAGFTNTLAMTLNVNSQGATNVFKATAAGPSALTGGEIVLNQLVIAYFDGTQFEIQPFPLAGWGLLSGTGGIQLSTANPPLGFDGCSNLSITASVAASKLTLTFNGNNGATPSATNPILCAFRDATIANGDPVWVTATAALSMDTNAAGATLATTNSVPFRFWIVMFNNAGTLVPGIINCSTPTQIFPLVESNVATSVPISAAATSAGVFYTPNGTTVTAGAFRIVGYIEYSAGLATAGTYGIVPTKAQLFGPGIKKPGDVVQTVYATTTTPTTVNSNSNTATNLAGSIIVSSNANLVRVRAVAQAQGASIAATGQSLLLQLHRNTGAVAIGNLATMTGTTGTTGNTSFTAATVMEALDVPASSNWPPTQYAVYGKDNTGTNSWSFLGTGLGVPTNTGILIIDEIMG